MNAATWPFALHAHVVGFYDDDQELVDHVAEHLIGGVSVGSPALVVAAVAHCRELRKRLAIRRIDTESTGAAGTVRSSTPPKRTASIIRKT